MDARAAPPSLWSQRWCSPDKLAIATAQTRGPSKDGRLLRQNWERENSKCKTRSLWKLQTMWWSFQPMRLTSGERLGGCQTGLGFRGEEGEPGEKIFYIVKYCRVYFWILHRRKKQCPHLCGCQRVCLRQDTSVLTQLVQLSPQTVAVPGDLIRCTNKNVRLESLSKAHWWDKRGSFPLIICPCFKPPPLWAPWPASHSPPLWWSARGAEGPKVLGTVGKGAAARVGTGSDWSPAPGRLNSR